MSKRLQIIVQDQEFKMIQALSRKKMKTVSEIVREGIALVFRFNAAKDPEARIAAVLKYARFNGPTADIEEMLKQIDEGAVG